jgi:SulP family sulfate permease
MPGLNQNRAAFARRLRPLHAIPTEFGAGFADVGVLLPIAIALIALNGLNPSVVFVSVGLMYIASGLFFRLPVLVQPFKAMAAIAISTGASAALLGAAGVAMGLNFTQFCRHLDA